MFVLILASTASSTKVRVLAEARIVGALPGGHLPGFLFDARIGCA